MTLLTILATTFLCTLFLLLFALDGLAPLIETVINRKQKMFERHLQALFVRKWTAMRLLKLLGAAMLVLGVTTVWITGSFAAGLLIVALIWIAPGPIFDHFRSQRVVVFEENFPATLDKMVSSAKAGLSLIQIFDVVAKQDKAPASDDFGLAVQDYQLGNDMGVVIENMKERLNSSLFNLFATAALVNREKGGNLPETLSTMSASFKEINRLEEKVVTASSEGRKGARVISLMPIAIFLFVSTLQPALIETLTSNLFGWLIIFVAAVFYAAGLFWLRKVLEIEV